MGVMGAGTALAIRTQWPKAYDEYRLLCRTSAPLLGTAQFVRVEPGITVANIFGQYRYGRDRRHTDYGALAKGLHFVQQLARDRDALLLLPYGIGCSLAGGDWNDVRELIVLHAPEAVLCRLMKKGGL
jgi:hypothetical protein